jgi:putative peptidoglycan lipid II flippase
MTSSHSTATRAITRSALIVMIGLVLSQAVGLLRTILVTWAFGTSAAYDAFNTANRLPDILFQLMAGGALASAFIPTYTGFLVAEKREEANRLASAVGSWIFVLLMTSSALCAIFAPQLVRYVLAPGYFQPDKIQTFHTTVSLLRILLLCPIIFGVSGLVMGILNAHHRFFLSALAPMFYSLGWIGGVLFLVPSMGIYGLAWGVVSGACLHLAVQLPALFSLHPIYRFSLSTSDPAVRNVARLMAPRVIGQSAVQFNFLVNTMLTSVQSVGNLSALTLAFNIMLMPEIAIAQATATAAFPTLSAQVSRGEIGPMRSTLVSILRGVFFLALPASIGLILLARPIVRILFERGVFDAQSTNMVVWALYFYAAGLVAHSIVEVLSRAFFALQNTIIPVAVSVGGMIINVALSLLLVGAFSAAGWMPHGALALANTLATAAEMTALLVFLRRKIKRLLDRDGWLSLARTVFSAAVMAAALVFWTQALHFESKWIAGLGGISVGLIIYGGVSLAIGSQEARSIVRMVVSRIRSVVS